MREVADEVGLTRFIRRLVVLKKFYFIYFILVFFLIGCAYEPPSPKQYYQCTQQCAVEKNYCIGRCKTVVKTCQYDANKATLLAQKSYQQYVQEHLKKHKKLWTGKEAFNDYYDCANSCKCGRPYRQCLKECV